MKRKSFAKNMIYEIGERGIAPFGRDRLKGRLKQIYPGSLSFAWSFYFHSFLKLSFATS
jgi:hypothetical protein